MAACKSCSKFSQSYDSVLKYLAGSIGTVAWWLLDCGDLDDGLRTLLFAGDRKAVG